MKELKKKQKLKNKLIDPDLIRIMRDEFSKYKVYAWIFTDDTGTTYEEFVSESHAEKALLKSVRKTAKRLKETQKPFVVTMERGTIRITKMKGSVEDCDVAVWTRLYRAKTERRQRDENRV